MEYRYIVDEVKDQIAWVTLNRPEVMNASNQEISQEIVSVSRQADEDPEVRVVIFKGAGEKAFSTAKRNPGPSNGKYQARTSRWNFHYHLYGSLIAATALEYNLTLVTRNTEDYADVPGLKLYRSS